MPHIHWVARQNKLEIPEDKDEINKREIHACDGRAHDPDTMVAPLTPKPTRKAEALARAPPTIASSQVYLQQNKKKAKAEGKNCHAKTMWSQEKPI